MNNSTVHDRRTRSLAAGVFLATFVIAGGVALLGELLLGIMCGWRHAHTLSHYLFGLGFPLGWAAIFVSPRAERLKSWQVGLASWSDRHYQKGFWIGAAITEIWSTWNELFAYLVLNPSHTLDWHHWIADLSGVVTALIFFQRVTPSSERRHEDEFN